MLKLMRSYARASVFGFRLVPCMGLTFHSCKTVHTMLTILLMVTRGNG